MRNASAEVRDTATTGGVRWVGVRVWGLRSENFISSSAKLIRSGMRVTQIMVDL